MLRQMSKDLAIRASRPGLFEFTNLVENFVQESGIGEGLLTIFCRHTSASLLIQENAAPSARRDLEVFFEKVAPEGEPYHHEDEGSDDMPAHLRTALTTSQLSIPVRNCRLSLGTWQGIFLFEHRKAMPVRHIALHLIGE